MRPPSGDHAGEASSPGPSARFLSFVRSASIAWTADSKFGAVKLVVRVKVMAPALYCLPTPRTVSVGVPLSAGRGIDSSASQRSANEGR